jgi:hypothetical protein
MTRPVFNPASGGTCGAAQAHASAFKRTLDWPVVGEGRRILDLRHTAACLWLARGVNPEAVLGVDGARVDRDDEPLPALPRNVR